MIQIMSRRSVGAVWGEDGSILIGGFLGDGMRLLPPSGGQAAKLTDLGSRENAHVTPQFLPGGKFAMFSFDATANKLHPVSVHAVKCISFQRRRLNGH